MTFDVGQLNDAVLDTFGDNATVQLRDGNITGLRGVLSTPYAGADFHGQSFERLDTTFEVKACDWAAVGGDIGTTLTIHDAGYTVTDVSTDEGGITRLVLRGYP